MEEASASANLSHCTLATVTPWKSKVANHCVVQLATSEVKDEPGQGGFPKTSPKNEKGFNTQLHITEIWKPKFITLKGIRDNIIDVIFSLQKSCLVT